MSSKAVTPPKCLQSVAISAVLSDRRRGCRAAESPAWCRHRGSGRGFPGRRRRADTARRQIAPVCRRAARRAWPVVAPGASVPCCDGIGAQLVARTAGGGAVCAGGVAGPGGACALTAPDAAIRTQERRSEMFIRMTGKRSARADVPRQSAASLLAAEGGNFRICGSGSARNVPSAASAGVRSG